MDPLEGLLDPTRPAQFRAEAAIAKAKIQAMGIAPSDREIDEAGDWSVYAARLIPYIVSAVPKMYVDGRYEDAVCFRASSSASP